MHQFPEWRALIGILTAGQATPIRLPENSKSRTTAPTGTTVGKVTLQIYFTEVKETPHKARLTALHVIRLQIFLKN